ncbi:hypothetical protein L0F63_004482 [Massospora cicadina]|nr:hypothetical protein L0F63_004482 [Massospora cicadina]
MEVTKENFATTLPVIEKALESCEFYAIDLEMTGIVLPGRKINSVENLGERYQKNRRIARSYLPVQFGLCTFERKFPGDTFLAKSFCFYIYPEPNGPDRSRTFSCQSNTLAFLLRHQFNFYKWIRLGIPFSGLNVKIERPSGNYVKSDIAMGPTNAEFMTLLREKLHGFFTDSTAVALKVATASALERRLVYQESNKICGKGVTISSNGHGLIVQKKHVSSPSHAKEAESHAAMDINFTALIKLLIASKKPMVGHNCYMDLCFTLHHFGKWASLYLERPMKNHSALDKLVAKFEETILQKDNFKIVLDGEEQKSRADTDDSRGFHNAGHDAFCTGKVLLHMLAQIQKPNSGSRGFDFSALSEYQNKVYNMLSEFDSINLTGPDEHPEVKFEKFLVSGFSRGVTTQDLAALFQDRPLRVDKVYWVDDTRCWMEFSAPSAIPLCANPELNPEQKAAYFSKIPTGSVEALWEKKLLAKPEADKVALFSGAKIIPWKEWYESTVPKDLHSSVEDTDESDVSSDSKSSEPSAFSDNPDELALEGTPERLGVNSEFDIKPSLPKLDLIDEKPIELLAEDVPEETAPRPTLESANGFASERSPDPVEVQLSSACSEKNPRDSDLIDVLPAPKKMRTEL